MQAVSCPQCQEPQSEPSHKFCTNCGLALKQPCPHCSSELDTPADPFLTCPTCRHDFWSCTACGRLYHLDRTSCHNSYCPEQGKFWTTRFGSDVFFQTAAERTQALSHSPKDSPRPAWLGGVTTASDLRWPNLHTLGLILSVQESGVVELWGERGAPHQAEGSDFQETSVCLTRIDLGEISPCPPFHWEGQFFIPGSKTLSILDMSSSPSIGRRIALEAVGKPKHFGLLHDKILVWGEKGLGSVSKEGECLLLHPIELSDSSILLTDGQSRALLVNELPFLFQESGELLPLPPIGFKEKTEFAIFTKNFVLFSGKNLAYLDKETFHLAELPALVVSQPLYSESDERLILLLSDGTVRTCSPKGDKFSYLCDLAGTPTTDPLKLGERVFYGTEGRYLCCDEEAIRPRLSSQPSGALSYANGRLFGNLRDGSMFCFEL